MEVQFSEHSKQRLISRKICLEDLRGTISEPDRILDSYKDRKLFQKKIHDKILEVVTVEEDNKIIVITAYLLEEDK